MKRILATLGLLAAALAGVTTATAASATACTTTVHANTEGVTLTAGGTATVAADGLVLKTTVNDDAVNWRRDVAPVSLASIQTLSYATRKLDNGATNAAALPAYRLYLVDMDGANETTTLIYEPYYNIVGNPVLANTQTWDVDAGKWWASKTVAGIVAEPGGSYAGNKTLADVVAANPRAKVVAFAVGQGTYNAGTEAKVNNVRFDVKGPVGCQEHTWKAAVASSSSPAASSSSSKPASQSPSGSASASASVSTSPTGSPSSTPSASTTPPVVTRPAGLPLTGAPLMAIGGAGVLLIAAGGAALWLLKRRDDQFEA